MLQYDYLSKISVRNHWLCWAQKEFPSGSQRNLIHPELDATGSQSLLPDW